MVRNPTPINPLIILKKVLTIPVFWSSVDFSIFDIDDIFDIRELFSSYSASSGMSFFTEGLFTLFF